MAVKKPRSVRRELADGPEEAVVDDRITESPGGRPRKRLVRRPKRAQENPEGGTQLDGEGSRFGDRDPDPKALYYQVSDAKGKKVRVRPVGRGQSIGFGFHGERRVGHDGEQD